MSVIRVVKSDNFTILINDTLRDERLSLEATGLLVRLLSRPSDWMVRFEALRRESRVGRDKLRRILQELSRTGYLVRRRVRRRNGKFLWLTEVHEAPQTSDLKSVSGPPTSDWKTVDGKPVDLQRNDLQRNTTTTTTQGRGRGGDMDDLVLPHCLGQTEARAARKLLSTVGKDAQALMDVLQAAITAGEIRKSKMAYLKALIARHRTGEFDPTPGLPIAKARERKRRRPRTDEKPTTEAVLREHARLLRQDEKSYLERCKAASWRARYSVKVAQGGQACQGGQP